MKNFKKILISLSFIFLPLEFLCYGDVNLEVGKDVVKVLAPAIVEATKVIADSNVEIAKIMTSGAVDASKVLGSDAATAFADGNLAIVKEIMPYAGPAIVVATAVYSVTQLQPIVKETIEIFYPTKEQRAREDKAGEVVEYIAARVKLRNCLMGSKSGCEKNVDGCPCVCEEAATAFAMIGGETEVERMVSALNKYRK